MEAQKKYFHVEKEALSVISGGVTRPLHYLHKRQFTLITHHKPWYGL